MTMMRLSPPAAAAWRVTWVSPVSGCRDYADYRSYGSAIHVYAALLHIAPQCRATFGMLIR